MGTLLEATRFATNEIQRRTDTERYFNDPVAWGEYMIGAHLWSKQRDVMQSVVTNKSTAVKAAHGVSKAVTLDTRIPTPSGWTTMGEIRVGDKLFTEAGEVTHVASKSPVHKAMTYRVVFDDGSHVDASDEHQWSVIDLRFRKRIKKRPVRDWRDHWDATDTYTTKYLYEHLLTDGGQRRWRIPIARSLDLPEQDLPIDPYVFGAWLGDGHSNMAWLTSHTDDVDVRNQFAARGYPLRKMAGKYAWSFTDNGGLSQVFRGLGVWKNKHIPKIYLRSSYVQRLELLRGLMDTDGTIDKRGVSTLSFCSKKLAQTAHELIQSLGLKSSFRSGPATLNGRVVGTEYSMTFRSIDVVPFHLTRKVKRWNPAESQASRSTQRTIVDILPLGERTVQCLGVTSSRHLFLVGGAMIPTHNSYTAGFLACWWIDTRTARYDDTFVVTTAPSLQQVAGILWREIRTFKKMIDDRYAEGLIDHKLPGTINAFNEWKDERGKLIGFGRKPPDNKEESGLQGIHGHVFAVADEACGVSLDMIDALANITSNEGSRRLLIGNPTNPASHFGKIFKENTGVWSLHTISVFDSPHFTDEKETTPQHVLDVLTGPQYVEDKRLEYGENSARYKARVLGEFAWDLGDTLITPEDLAVAHDTEIHPLESDSVKLGVDIARYGCFDDQTEILTDEGWKLFSALRGDERVMSLPEKGRVAEWMPITKIHRYPFDGVLNYYERRGANFAITDSHNLLAKPAQGRKGWSIKRYDSLPQEILIRKENTWAGENPTEIKFETRVPLPNGGERIHSYVFDYLDWAEFLGWFVSEGNVYRESRGGGRLRVMIAQNPGPKADRISSLLTRMGLKSTYKKSKVGPSGQFEFTSKSIGQWLLDNCGHLAPNKRIPTELKNSSPEALFRFLESFRLGDGTRNKRGSNVYMTSSPRLADDIQEVLCKLGRGGKLTRRKTAGSTSEIDGRVITRTADMHVVYEKRPTRSEGVYVKKSHVDRRRYVGDVWCVSTPYRTIMVRRGGIPMWSGNSDRSVIYVNTGGRVRLYKAFDKNSLVQLANEVHNAAIDFGASEVRYDLQGIGQGFEELLFQLEPRPYKMIGLSGSSASPDRRQWYNARAYWWDRVRRQLREGSLDIDLGDENLNDELVMVEYKFAPSGGLLLESKDEMRKRGVKSPDFADAFVYASVDLDDMLNPEPKKQTTYEDAETVMGDDVPNYLGLLVQGW